jgi:phage terminase large subunit-like protein
VAYDRWRVELLLKELDRVGIDTWVDGKDKRRAGALRLVPWGQGYKDMAPAVDALETSVIERKFKHNGNPVLTWNMQNAMAITDPAGNRKLDKSKTRFRIDGAIAITMAIGLKYREIEPAPREIKMPVSA